MKITSEDNNNQNRIEHYRKRHVRTRKVKRLYGLDCYINIKMLYVKEKHGLGSGLVPVYSL